MASAFQHGRHLLRMAVLYCLWVGGFLVVRSQFVPEGFGEHGHYRPAAVGEIAARAPHFAGKASCLECHDEVSQDPAQSHHARLACASCHGPLAAHAQDPAVAPAKLGTNNELCLQCHRTAAAKPAWFQQVEPVAHAENATCVECHQPHAP